MKTRRIVAIFCTVLGTCALARAQTTGIGPSFNPGAGGNIFAMVAQPDGKILVSG